MEVEKAIIKDVPQIHALINRFAEKDEMLARSLSEIYENIRDYFVIRDGDRVVACVALHVIWDNLAEVKSLAVAEGQQRQGLGLDLVRICVDEARNIGLGTVFCLTYKPDFFQRAGFTRIDKMELPQKVWTECFRCPKFPNCDEVALVYRMEV